MENKKVLLQKVKAVTGESWNQDVLIIGWARRLVPYKRPTVLFENTDRIRKILEEKNSRVIVSGTLHPGDFESKDILEYFKGLFENMLKGYAVFLPEYNLNLAKIMTAGCDVWLNTPAVGFEACGTSGMKAALNGSLPVSTLDGWIPEVNLYGIGWSLDSDKINKSLLDTLENNIAPFYFQKDDGIPTGWVENMKLARSLIRDRFSTTRMLRDYIEQLYTPLLPVK
jgi:starch phosphorylase